MWDWANDQMLHQFPVSSHATAMDFCYNDIILGDGKLAFAMITTYGRLVVLTWPL